MKGTRPSPIVGSQFLESLAHLVRGFVGKRQRHDVVGWNIVGDHVGDAMGDHTGFTTAWPSENQQWPMNLRNGSTLILVQRIENGIVRLHLRIRVVI